MDASGVFSLAFFSPSFAFENVKTKQDLNTHNFTVIRTDIKPGKIDTCLVESH